MKCLAVFSSLPDLIFLWVDEQLKQHLINRAEKIGLTEPNGSNEDYDDEQIFSYANHFFSPIVTSNRYMQEIVNNSYRAIICDNGFHFCMCEKSELFFIAVCGDGEESEHFLQRKINFFHYLLLSLYGPCASSQLKPQSISLRKETWKNLIDLLITWQTLCQQEQMFLVEALERLHVNQQLNSISLNLLGDALIKTNKDGRSVHALLLVNNKLLGLYSNERSPELKVSDILLLIVLVKNKFQYSDKTVPNSLYRTSPLLSEGNIQLKNDETLFSLTDTDSLFNYRSANSTPSSDDDNYHTPAGKLDQEALIDCVSSYEISMNEADLEILETSSDDEEDDARSPDDEISFSTNDTLDEEDPLSEVIDESKEDIVTDENVYAKQGYFNQRIFLQTDQHNCAPHNIYCLLLDNATVLIIISQNNTIRLAVFIQELLNNLNCFHNQKFPFSQLKIYENIERNISKILSQISRNLELNTREINRTVKIFGERWKIIKNNKFEELMKSDNPLSELPKLLENSLEELLKCTKELFVRLFLSKSLKQPKEERRLKIALNIREIAIRKLHHFSSYLYVRGQCNVTMTAYHNDFPGLVHFIYINRNIDQLVAPTINVHDDSSFSYELPIYVIVKQRIWDMWQYMETMLGHGYTALIVRHGDFTYSYFLWFEDVLSKPLIPTKSVKEIIGVTPTGILSSTFYKDVIHYLFPNEPEGSVHCYELFCMHIGVVNNHFVSTSAQKLARLLWEASGEVNAPINLL